MTLALRRGRLNGGEEIAAAARGRVRHGRPGAELTDVHQVGQDLAPGRGLQRRSKADPLAPGSGASGSHSARAGRGRIRIHPGNWIQRGREVDPARRGHETREPGAS
jgi:hypothetical protein